jgi:hypothetical protein
MQSILAFLCCAGLLASTAVAQNYSLTWYKVAGGGATSTGGVYSVSGTIGQHDAGPSLTGSSDSVTGGFWALYAIQTSGAPTLFITRSGNNAVFYWSASATGYQLERKADLANPGSWSAVVPSPVLLSGFNYVTNPIVGGNNFYRLHHP